MLKQPGSPYLSELLVQHSPSRGLRSGTQKLLAIQKQRGHRVFAIVGPKLWNSLPFQVRSVPSLPIFKSLLKTYFYSLAFNNQ